jgi:hypothetical protein
MVLINTRYLFAAWQYPHAFWGFQKSGDNIRCLMLGWLEIAWPKLGYKLPRTTVVR